MAEAKPASTVAKATEAATKEGKEAPQPSLCVTFLCFSITAEAHFQSTQIAIVLWVLLRMRMSLPPAEQRSWPSSVNRPVTKTDPSDDAVRFGSLSIEH